MSMIYLNQLGMISPLGNSLGATKRALLDLGQSGVALSDAFSPGRRLPVGRIDTNCPCRRWIGGLCLTAAATINWRWSP